MDQIKIGKFISECRRSKHLTQMQLAEKLNITDRAVSKWETGKGMPDTSIMLELCGELGIGVNELLSGEKIEMNHYYEKAEENLMELKRDSERMDKRLRGILRFFKILSGILSVGAVLSFAAHLVMNYLEVKNYHGELFDVLLPIFITLAIVFSLVSFVTDFLEKYQIVERR